MEAFKVTNAFLDHQKGCIAWPILFQAVKAIVRANGIPDDVRSCIKGWIKDVSPVVALQGIAVVQTISLNVGQHVRSQLAGPKWQERLEKTLAKPASPIVGAAVAQLLVDWAFLYGSEELGRVARATLNMARHRSATQELRPSQVAVDAADEAALGIPAVGPRRGVDFIALYHKALASAASPSSSAGGGGGMAGPSAYGPFAGNADGSSTGGSRVSMADLAAASVSSLGLGRPSMPTSGSGRSAHGASSSQQAMSAQSLEALAAALCLSPTSPTSSAPVTPAMVPGMISQMEGQAVELRRACAAARAATAVSGVRPSAGGKLPPQLAAAVNHGYEAAERCSAWRQRVADATATLDDAAAVVALLGTLDTEAPRGPGSCPAVNGALSDWQAFASGGELFRALGISASAAAAAFPRRGGAALSPPQARLLDFDEAPLSSARTAVATAGATAGTAGGRYTPQATGSSAYGPSLLDEPAHMPAYPTAHTTPNNSSSSNVWQPQRTGTPAAAAPTTSVNPFAAATGYTASAQAGPGAANNPFAAAPAWVAAPAAAAPAHAPAAAQPAAAFMGVWGWARSDSTNEQDVPVSTASHSGANTPSNPSSFVAQLNHAPSAAAPPAGPPTASQSPSTPHTTLSPSLTPAPSASAPPPPPPPQQQQQPQQQLQLQQQQQLQQVPSAGPPAPAKPDLQPAKPDWQAEFATLISRLQVSAGATGGGNGGGALTQGVTSQLWGFVQRVQLHYEGALSTVKQQAASELASTKERAVGVMRDLKQQLAESQGQAAALRAQLQQATAAQQHTQQQLAQLQAQLAAAQQQQQHPPPPSASSVPAAPVPSPNSYKVLQLGQPSPVAGLSRIERPHLPPPPQLYANGVYKRPGLNGFAATEGLPQYPPLPMGAGGGAHQGAQSDQNGWQLL